LDNPNHRKIFGPDEHFTDEDQDLVDYADANNIITVYAVWAPSVGNLQGWSGCSSMSTNDVIALTDIRDNNTYAVAKLADGNCWTIENLRLDFSNLSSGVDIAIENTNNPSTGFASSLASTSSTSPGSWCNTNSAACDNKISYNTDALANPGNVSTNWGTPVYGYGVYYNWYTATAGHGTYSMSSGNTPGDICPQSWHLPASADFSYITVANLKVFPQNYVSSGQIWSASMHNVENITGIWSKTANATNLAYRLYATHSSIENTNTLNKYAGESVRCIVNESTTFSISYNLNGASGTAPEGNSVASTRTYQDFTIPDDEPTRSHYIFLGWSTNSSATTADYTAGNQLRVTSATTELFAVWEPLPYRIIYNGNNPTAGNMSSVEHQNVIIGSYIRLVAPNY
jgi:uncharacterized protein (TIGR02145 family)